MASWWSICPSEMEQGLALATWPLLLMVWLQPGRWTRQECGPKLGKVLGGARLVQVGVFLTAPGPRPRATDRSHSRALRHPQSHPVAMPCPERYSKVAKAREALQNSPSPPQISSRPTLSHTKSGTAVPHLAPKCGAQGCWATASQPLAQSHSQAFHCLSPGERGPVQDRLQELHSELGTGTAAFRQPGTKQGTHVPDCLGPSVSSPVLGLTLSQTGFPEGVWACRPGLSSLEQEPWRVEGP